jgi:hypothetical protein
MSEVESAGSGLLQQAVDACKHEHQELSEQWDALDAKAQGTMTVAGIFVAGILAFINALSSAAAIWEKRLLTTAAILLGACVVAALRAIAVREVTAAPVGKQLLNVVNDLLEKGEPLTPSRLNNFARDHMRMWEVANADMRRVNTSKAKPLAVAQWLLFAAIVCAVVVTVIKIWGPHNVAGNVH